MYRGQTVTDDIRGRWSGVFFRGRLSPGTEALGREGLGRLLGRHGSAEILESGLQRVPWQTGALDARREFTDTAKYSEFSEPVLVRVGFGPGYHVVEGPKQLPGLLDGLSLHRRRHE